MKTADNKYNPSKVEKVAEYVDQKLNREEIGHLIDTLYWKHKKILAGTVKVITQDIEAYETAE